MLILEVVASVNQVRPIANSIVNPPIYKSLSRVVVAVVKIAMAAIGKMQATTVATKDVNFTIVNSGYLTIVVCVLC